MENLIYKIALSKIKGVGSVGAKNLISYCGGLKEIFEAKKKSLLKIPQIGEKTAHEILDKNILLEAEKEVLKIEKANIEILFFTDQHYPKRLKELNDSPILLFHKGNTNFSNQKCIAIVGTRKSTTYGKQITEKIIEELSVVNPLIVSGLAYGIDITAHRKALENNIQTVGVMANGLDIVYPYAHKKTTEEMVTNGGLLSEEFLGKKPELHAFPSRNRIIAGLADVTIVVEAAKKGGALITANIANSYNREVFAVPGRVNDEFSEGCNSLIKNHSAHIFCNTHDFLEFMNWNNEQIKNPQKNIILSNFSVDEQLIIDALMNHKELEIDRISRITDLPINKTASCLLSLEFSGIVKLLPGKKYILK